MVLYNIYRFIKNRFTIYKNINNEEFFDLEVYDPIRKEYYHKTLSLIKEWLYIKNKSKAFSYKRYKYILGRIDDMKNLDINIRSKLILYNNFFYNLIN